VVVAVEEEAEVEDDEETVEPLELDLVLPTPLAATLLPLSTLFIIVDPGASGGDSAEDADLCLDEVSALTLPDPNVEANEDEDADGDVATAMVAAAPSFVLLPSSPVGISLEEEEDDEVLIGSFAILLASCCASLSTLSFSILSTLSLSILSTLSFSFASTFSFSFSAVTNAFHFFCTLLSSAAIISFHRRILK